MKRLLVLLLLPLLVACGSSRTVADDPSTTTPDPSPSASPSAGTPADGPLLWLEEGGGFTSADIAFRTLPQLVVLQDGTFFVPGVMPEIYPGPAVQEVETGRLSVDQVQQLIDLAGTAGLLAPPPDYGNDQTHVSDAPSTTLTLTVGGSSYVHDAYALDVNGGTNSPARQALADFIAKAEGMITPIATQPFRPDALLVQAGTPDPHAPSDVVKPNTVDWPASADESLAAIGSCQVIKDPATVHLIGRSTQITRYRDGGETYVLSARVLLPGDPGCRQA